MIDAGRDYVSVMVEESFGPEVEQKCFFVLLIQDGVCENVRETFDVQLISTRDGDIVIDTAIVVIYDASECSKFLIIYTLHYFSVCFVYN